MRRISTVIAGYLFAVIGTVAGEYHWDVLGNVSIRGTGSEIGVLLKSIPDTVCGVDIINEDSTYVAGLGAWLQGARKLSVIALNHCDPRQIRVVLDSVSNPVGVDYVLLKDMDLQELPYAVRLFTNLESLIVSSCNISSLPSWLFDLPMLESIYYEENSAAFPVRNVSVNTSIDLTATSNGLYREFGSYADSLYQVTGIRLTGNRRVYVNNLGYRTKVEILTHLPVKKMFTVERGDIIVLLSRLITDARERPEAFGVSSDRVEILRRTSYLDKVLHLEEFEDHFVLEGMIKIQGLLAKRLQILVQRAR